MLLNLVIIIIPWNPSQILRLQVWLEWIVLSQNQYVRGMKSEMKDPEGTNLQNQNKTEISNKKFLTF